MALLTQEILREHWHDSGQVVTFNKAGTYHINGRLYDVQPGDSVMLMELVQKKCSQCKQDLPTPVGIVSAGAWL